MQDLLEIEKNISTQLKPHFLAVTSEDDVISVVVSHPSFLFQQMHERVSNVFKIIKKHNSEILKRKIVVVQPFTSDEIMDIFEYWV